MKPRFPRWVYIVLIVLAALVVLGALGLLFTWLIRSFQLIGLVVSVLILGGLAYLIYTGIQPLLKIYRFNKYYQQHEAQLRNLPSLMQTGRKQEAVAQFENVMKEAPDSAFMLYTRAFFLQAAERYPEALSATNKALEAIGKDAMLPAMLKEGGGQMGQPTTVQEFRERLEELKRTLEPRVREMRLRREKAVAKRKKKSR